MENYMLLATLDNLDLPLTRGIAPSPVLRAVKVQVPVSAFDKETKKSNFTHKLEDIIGTHSLDTNRVSPNETVSLALNETVPTSLLELHRSAFCPVPATIFEV